MKQPVCVSAASPAPADAASKSKPPAGPPGRDCIEWVWRCSSNPNSESGLPSSLRANCLQKAATGRAEQGFEADDDISGAALLPLPRGLGVGDEGAERYVGTLDDSDDLIHRLLHFRVLQVARHAV